MKPQFPSLLLGALMLGAGFSAIAQNAPPPPPEAPMHHKGPMGHGGRMDPAKIEAMHTKHMAELKTKLKITPAQEAAWTTFSAAMKPPTGMVERKGDRPERAAMDKLTMPERIDKMREFRAKHAAERQAAMEQRENAAKTFYGSLNDEQKKVMDTEHSRMARAMEHMRDRRHGDGRKAPPAPPVPPAPPAAPATK